MGRFIWFCGLTLAIANGGASLRRTINPTYNATGLIVVVMVIVTVIVTVIIRHCFRNTSRFIGSSGNNCWYNDHC